MANEAIAYSKTDLRDVLKAFKVMDEQATDEARIMSAELATFASEEIKTAARGRTKSGKVATRVADGVKVSKTSKIGEFKYGFASQKFSGGATTQTLWGGIGFGSNKFKQFPSYSGRQGRGWESRCFLYLSGALPMTLENSNTGLYLHPRAYS